jgi:hypothetical protein
MATAGIQTNIEAVKEAIRLYGLMVKKDADIATRKKMGDIAFQAGANTYHTEKDKLRAEISSLPITKDGGRKRYGNTQYVGQYKLINWERKQKGLLPLGNSRTRGTGIFTRKVKKDEDGEITSVSYVERKRKNRIRATLGPSLRANPFMDGKYKSFIQSRVRSIKFIRAAWGVAAQFFGKPFTRGDFGPGALARFSGLQYGGGDIKPIGENITEYSMFNGAGRYDTRKRPIGSQQAPERSSGDQEKAARIIEDGLNKGIQAVISDITQYFEQRAKRLQYVLRNLNRVK